MHTEKMLKVFQFLLQAHSRTCNAIFYNTRCPSISVAVKAALSGSSLAEAERDTNCRAL